MSHKLSIVFYVNGMEFDGNSLAKHSLGGSETAGLCMAREMSKRGHDVAMFCNTKVRGKFDGVRYFPVSDFHTYMGFTQVDVCIIQRIPQVFSTQLKSKINILWQHDLGVKRARKDFVGSLWNIDEVFALSDFHIKQMAEVYRVPEDVFWKTRNGIDPIKINKGVKRHPKRLIYTARPERGMDILLNDIMPKVWEKDPEVELHLAGYDNTVEQMKPFYDSLKAKIAEYQSKGFKVKHLGPLSKKDLYREYQEATMYVYPTEFEETSCITAMECMANGLPMITTQTGALPETLAPISPSSAAFLAPGNIREEEYQSIFVEYIMGSLARIQREKSVETKAIKHAENLHWSGIAEEWEDHFYEMFKERTANTSTLARHLYRNEDIMTVLHLDNPQWNDRIRKEYPFIWDETAYSRLYTDYGKRFRADVESGKLELTIQPYTRVKVALEIMRQNPPKDVLDYGCAIGNEAIQFVNEFGCYVDAVNITPDEIEVGKNLAEEHCKNPENICWMIGDSPDRVEDDNYDVVFGGEILEHVPNPTELIDKLEAKCKDGGKMIFTVPFGPWGDTDATLEQKGHLWSFERADLMDLFSKKKKRLVRSVAGSLNPKNKEMLGWFVIEYEKSNALTGTVNLDRKVAFQASRQSISACMIIGGQQEGLLHRCLQSIYPVVEEIIILDTGMSPESREIAEHTKYKGKVKIIEDGPNPLEVGFDEARNESLKYATGDWILWIDSDEEFLASANVFKYLKANKYAGYAIRQHHFSAQPINAFNADLPVRLFRNNIGAKFFGVVHEHPETGINKGIGFSTILNDVDIAHDGYLTEEVRRKRFTRNYDLLLRDREKYPDRTLGKFLMMRDWLHIARYTLEQTRGQLNDVIVEHCEKIIKMYKEDFAGEGQVYNREGLKFYSEALTILGRGLEYTFSLHVNDNSSLDDVVVARFEDKETFTKFIEAQLDVMCEPFDGRYV